MWSIPDCQRGGTLRCSLTGLEKPCEAVIEQLFPFFLISWHTVSCSGGLRGDQCHRVAFVPYGMCSTCSGVWADGLSLLALTWMPGCRVSKNSAQLFVLILWLKDGVCSDVPTFEGSKVECNDITLLDSSLIPEVSVLKSHSSISKAHFNRECFQWALGYIYQSASFYLWQGQDETVASCP